MDSTTQGTAGLVPGTPAASEIPLLSIGLPVYNGAAHLRQAIDSLLAQDVEDLELIISDNASTDETPLICAEYAAKDERVRFSRNDTNLGSAANFNRVFESSRGRYFMWGSHDDLWDPRFARLCIEELEKRPAAVMCTSQVRFIDQNGEAVTGWDRHESLDTAGMDIAARVHELIRRPGWYGFYAVYRPAALRSSQMCGQSFGMDVRLQLELLLQGDALALPETLLRYRLPARSKDAAQFMHDIAPHAPKGDGADTLLSRPYTHLATELLGVVRGSSLDPVFIERIEDDFADTLAYENHVWRDLILDEQGTPMTALSDRRAIRAAVCAALGVADHARRDEGGTASRTPWTLRGGARLRWCRRTLLRVLKPFTDAQNRLDVQLDDSVASLANEVRSLRARVKELEKRTGSDGDPGPRGA